MTGIQSGGNVVLTRKINQRWAALERWVSSFYKK